MPTRSLTADDKTAAGVGPIDSATPSAAGILRYQLNVVASTTADVVRSAGGWLYDSARAGWDVNVLVADGGDPVEFLLHVVALTRLGVPAVLAVAVPVDMARPAGHAQLHAGRRGGDVAGARVRRLGRGQRVLVGLAGPVEPYATTGAVAGQFTAA